MGSTDYTYDAANRLVDAGGVAFTWDNNGNLLSDGVSSYAYDTANRLAGVTQGGTAYTFAYNGLGDRLQQTVGGVTTNYAIDLNAGLTQVLADGTSSYLYGLGRIGQQAVEWAYHLPDALGSVRQLADPMGAVSYAQSFEPYGEVLAGFGEAASSYGFTGEWGDGTGLVYLRARYYDTQDARFISPDPLNGYQTRPATYNKWVYAFSNPVIFVDPAGLSPQVECEKIFFDNMRRLCHLANGADDDPATLEAREWFYWNIVVLSYAAGPIDEGYFWAGEMLRNFLINSSFVEVDLPGDTAFGQDPGILRATKYLLPQKVSDEPATITPLLSVFLNHITEEVKCDSYQVLPDFQAYGAGTYDPQGTFPRAYSKGWWGAFGHVTIDAIYSDVSTKGIDTNNYMVGARVDYKIQDHYGWRRGWFTPLPLGNIQGFGVSSVDIPHEWAISLTEAGLASEYNFTVTWAEYLQITVTKDFRNFSINQSLPFTSSILR